MRLIRPIPERNNVAKRSQGDMATEYLWKLFAGLVILVIYFLIPR